jgi:hypothetical protein
MPGMKRLALLAMMLVACEKTPSKLEGNLKGGDGEGGPMTAEVEGMLRGIEERITALETAHKNAPGPSGTSDAAVSARLQKVEANLARREEALGFLEMAYAQQKRQQEAKEAGEHDPNAVFAVDISGALKAGQVEGPNSAIVTIVEAWDFA